MRSKSPVSMRHVHRCDAPATPDDVRITRPLRDLLAAGDDGLRNTCRHAWAIAAAGGGRWTVADPVRLLGGGHDPRVRGIELRTRGGHHLDLTVHFDGDCGAIAIGRRVIVIAPILPETVLTAVNGRPLSVIVDAPCLSDPAIVIQRSIPRDGGRYLDLRCRCPSHLVDIRAEEKIADGVR